MTHDQLLWLILFIAFPTVAIMLFLIYEELRILRPTRAWSDEMEHVAREAGRQSVEKAVDKFVAEAKKEHRNLA